MPHQVDRRAVVLGMGAAALAAPGRAFARDAEDIQLLVDNATSAAQRFVGGIDVVWVKQNIGSVKGALIVPSLIKGGFIFGGSGGSGTLLGRDPVTGSWSYPSFHSMGSGTFGLQIGVEVSEIVLLLMTQGGLDAMLSTKFTLGGDISVAAGPVGVGAKAATADILAFSRTKGLYGGLNLEGAVISTRRKWNETYYGKGVSVSDIVIRRDATNPGAENLRAAVTALGQ